MAKAQTIYCVGVKLRGALESKPYDRRFYRNRTECADGVATKRKEASKGDDPAMYKVMKFVYAGDRAT